MSGRSKIHREVGLSFHDRRPWLIRKHNLNDSPEDRELGAAKEELIGRKKRRIRPEIPLPMHLVNEEILTRLPAKSLMRFNSVSKLWSSHINSPYFSNRFLTQRRRPRIYMCLLDPSDRHKDVMLSLTLDNTTTPSSFVVDHGLTILQRGCYFLQSLRGFMCYTSWEKPQIFNPATRQLVTLPAALESSKITPPSGVSAKIVSYYYGYDPVNGHYKVVCSTGVNFKDLQEMRSEHWVFVRGSWKKVAPTPLDYCPHLPARGGVCIDGVIYYLGWTSSNNCAVVSFHIRSEEFKTIQLPHRDDMSAGLYDVSVIEYCGKVTVIDQTNLRNKGLLDLWVVEDARNKKWLRKTMALQPCQLHLINGTIFNVKGTTQNGKLFFIPRRWFFPFHILYYDLQSNDLQKIEIKGVPEYWSNKEKSNINVSLIEMSESLFKVIDVDGAE
ncbi:unnamed protein product [Arabis nemorensis]|uniref:Uncharacterized protein n=1 Tax=Arabis nemorensis TaxID=586526 RepID=A0A565BEX2_9BRAS|nr:unnamed protein product [Arabis nemorensis]